MVNFSSSSQPRKHGALPSDPLEVEMWHVCQKNIYYSTLWISMVCIHPIVKHHKILRVWLKNHPAFWLSTIQAAIRDPSAFPNQESSQVAKTKSHERASACNENSLTHRKRSNASRHLWRVAKLPLYFGSSCSFGLETYFGYDFEGFRWVQSLLRNYKGFFFSTNYIFETKSTWKNPPTKGRSTKTAMSWAI